MNVEIRAIFFPPSHESQGTALRSPGLQDKYFPPPSHLAHPTVLFLSYHELLASSTLHNGAGEAWGSTSVMNTTQKSPLLSKVELIFPTKPPAASPSADEEQTFSFVPTPSLPPRSPQSAPGSAQLERLSGALPPRKSITNKVPVPLQLL